MKVRVDTDELYPLYDLCEGCGKEVEISDELYKEIKIVMDAFWGTQSVLEGLYRSKPSEKSPYAFCNMSEYEEDGVDDRGLLKFKLKERYKFSWENNNE